MSVNKAIIVGNLGADPEIRYLPSGAAVANLSVATSERWKDKETGQPKERTEWHRVSFFGRTAEVCAEYLRKGSQVYVEGSIQTRKWQDKDGKDCYSTEIKGREMRMLGSRDGAASSQPRPGPAQQQKSAPESAGYNQAPESDFDDDIPF